MHFNTSVSEEIKSMADLNICSIYNLLPVVGGITLRVAL